MSKEKEQDAFELVEKNKIHHDTPPEKPHNAGLIPEANANFFSRLSYTWLDAIVRKGAKSPLQSTDLYDLDERINAKHVSALFRANWKIEKSTREKPTLLHALFLSFGRRFVTAGFIKIISDCTQTFAPLFIMEVINFVNRSQVPGANESSTYGYLLAVGLLVVQLLGTLCLNRYFSMAMSTGFLIRTALVTGIYDKSLILSSAARNDFSNGKIVNLMSTDTSRIDLAAGFFHQLWSAPVQIIIAVSLLVNTLGASALAGLGILCIMGPLQGKIMQKLGSVRKLSTGLTDQRVKLTQEILQGIRVIKYYAWENSFLQRLAGLRNSELSLVRRLLMLRSGIGALMEVVPIFASIVTFIVYSAVGNSLDPAKVFTALALFNIVRFPLLLLPMAISFAMDAYIALRRIEEYMLAPDLDALPVLDTDAKSAIFVDGIDFVWDAPIENPPLKENERNGKQEKSKGVKQDSKGEPANLKAVESKKVRPEPSAAELLAPTDPVIVEGVIPESSAAELASQAVENDNCYYLRNINLEIPFGALVAIVGSVGSGKSSLLQALVGEMRNLGFSTSKTPKQVVFGGTVGYCPQTAWIQNGTLQANILFGQPMDRERYDRVLKQCQLLRDLEILPDGDLTEIGERGINISGGQKQRINIARAVYYDSDIVLMDDPLSAVDAHVGRALFEECIEGALAKKTRVLVTHALHYLQRVDLIICMEDGVIVERGTFSELMAANGAFSRNMKEYGGEHEESEEEEEEEEEVLAMSNGTVEGKAAMAGTSSESVTSKSKTSVAEQARKPTEEVVVRKTPQGLMTSEERSTGSVAFAVYMQYFRACGGHWVIPFVLLLIIIYQGAKISTDFWLSVWTNADASNDARSLSFYIGIYVGLGASQALLSLVLGIVIALLGARAARTLHKNAIERVFRAPMFFFDTTPLGRIVNRFSKDIDSIDSIISDSFRMFAVTLSSTLATFILITVILPWFLIPLVPLLGVYYFFQDFYRATSREIKRLDALTRSPLYAHFGETLTGLATIRAYRVQDHARESNENFMNGNNQAYYVMIMIQRWLSLRLETLAAFLVFFAMLFAVVQRSSVSASLIGLVITYALQSTGIINWCVRQLAEVEQNMNAVERVEYYAVELDVEAPAFIPDRKPPIEWPEKGNIEITDLELRYRSGLPAVLHGVSLSIKGGEKIGVVGRTGAGKSTIMVALFRLVEPSNGTILIDNVDITKIGLSDLRSHLAIIPQDPVIFAGTFRSNLDPFQKYTDQELWDSLSRADLKTYVSSTSNGLDSNVSEGGDNLSLGQRQLLCLARASLTNARIIVMDEATASVDLQTDALLQKAIRIDFADATVLTIAHRINTVIDYDKIMVLDAGNVVEFDTPKKLLSNPEGRFRSMVDETGPTNAALLESMAKG